MSDKQNRENDVVNDEINLFDIFLVLWKKRGKIIVWSVIFAVIVLAVGCGLFLFQGKYIVAELEFSLNFTGLNKGQYPNGSRFSANDIISGTVLRKVYAENGLDKYYSDFSDFQSSLSIFKDDFRLVVLRSEYAGKLDEEKLTVEGRDKLESEYQRRKKEILADANYKLVLNSGSGNIKLPVVLINKILRNILEVWLDNAEKEKGINKYQISLVTENVISKEKLSSLDYIVGLDLLRETIKTVKGDINKVSDLPGAKVISINGENGKINLSSLKFRINFMQTYQLEPLSGAIRSFGVSKEGPLSKIYLQSKLYELERNRNAITAVKDMYSKTLQSYSIVSSSETNPSAKSTVSGNSPTVIPQFDGSFFDKLVGMAQQDANIKYRQELTDKEIASGLEYIKLEKEIEYYQSLFDAFKKFSSSSREISKKDYQIVLNSVKEQQALILNSLIKIIKDTETFYNKINEYSLNSQSEFYTVSSFTVNSLKSLSLKKIIIGMVVIWIFLEVLLLAVVLLGNKINENK